MQINITGHTIDVTPAIRERTLEKLQRLEHHFDKMMSVHVILNVEKKTHIAEATIFIVKGDVHASAQSDDLYAAIDELMDKLDRQLIKHKEKQRK